MSLIIYDMALLILLTYGIHRGWFFTALDPRNKEIDRRVKELPMRFRFLRVLTWHVIFVPPWFALVAVLGLVSELSAAHLEHWWPPLVLVLFLAGFVMSAIMVGMACLHLVNRLFLRS